MKSPLKIYITFCLSLYSLMASHLIYGDAMVWKATKAGQTVYLGGTFHMLKSTDYPLNSVYLSTYRKASSIYFETDMEALTSMNGQRKMLQAMLQPTGKSLQSELKPDTYQELQTFIKSKGLNIESLQNYRVSMVVLMLTTIELAKLGVTPQSGVDMFFWQQAQADKKTVKGLEALDDHLSILANLAEGHEDEMVKQTLTQLHNLSAEYAVLVKAWKEADVKTLDEKMVAEIRVNPKLYRSLLVDRNVNWTNTIVKLSQTPEVEFFLVGAAHLVGNDSVIEMLKQRGFDVALVNPKQG